MNDERIACLLIEEFALEMFYQAEPSLVAQPTALTEGDHKTAPIVAINRAAIESGVLLGATALQSHVVCPDLIIKGRDTARETRQSQKLLRALRRIGPLSEKDTDGANGALTVFMETGGLVKLHKSESAIAEKIIALATSLGYPAKTGIADNKFIAKVAAEISGDNCYTIVNRGAGGAFIERLDIARLHLSPDTREILRDLGLKTIGRLAEFPINEITERFGQEGATLSYLSRGHDPKQFVRIHPKEDLSNEMHLTYRIYSTGAVVRHTEKLLPPLLSHLGNSGHGCRRLVLKLSFENHNEETLTISLEQPTLSLKKLSRQLRSQLERLQLTSAVTALAVTIPHQTIAGLPAGQLSFDHRHQHRKAGIMDNDTNLNNCILYTVTLNPALLPEQNFHLSPIDNSRRTKRANKHDTDPLAADSLSHPAAVAYCCHSVGGLRLLPSPIETEVITTTGGLSFVQHDSGQRRQIDHRFGPWELSGGWWRDDFDRLYYELHTADNRRYLFFYDRTCSRWFLQGVFD